MKNLNKGLTTPNSQTLLSHLGSILTDRQRLYITLRYHNRMRPIAIAQRFGTTKRAVNDAIARARKNLASVGIKLPIKPDADRDNRPFRVLTMDPHRQCETIEG